MDLARLKLAAEDAAWLVARGYPEGDVAAFVAAHHALSGPEQALLGKSARASANVKHHIARELDPEDIERRPLRVDVASVVGTVESALDGHPVLETEAGVLLDPAWDRARYHPGARFTEAVELTVTAALAIRPSAVSWLVDQAAPHAAMVGEALSMHPKLGRRRSEVERVASVPQSVARAGFVASCDLAALDACGTWINLASLALATKEGVNRVRL